MDNRLELLDLQRKWSAPSELGFSRPRPVKYTPAGRIVLGFACLTVVGALAAGICLGQVAFRDAANSHRLKQEGVVAEGLVTRLWTTRGESSQTWMAYRFVARERNYDARVKLPSRIWNNLKPGAAIPIRYVPSDPGLNCPSFVTRQDLPIWLPFAIGFVIAAGAAAMALVTRRQVRLLAEGRAAPALVTRLSDKVRSPHGGDHGQKFYYEFAILSGAIAKGHSGPTRRPPEVGSTLCVLYDPDNPAKNAPYPLSLVRVAR